MKPIKISANFKVDEMIKFDINKALKHYNIKPGSAKNLVKLILSDSGLENIEVNIKDRLNNIVVYLLKEENLKKGDKVEVNIDSLKRYDLVVDKVNGEDIYLKRVNGGLIEGSFNIVMVDEKVVKKC